MWEIIIQYIHVYIPQEFTALISLIETHREQ